MKGDRKKQRVEGSHERRVSQMNLPTGSTALAIEVEISDGRDGFAFRYTYFRDDESVNAEVAFEGVRAYRWRAESHCTAWHVAGTYNTLVEVENSEWIRELVMAEPPQLRVPHEMRHYMISFDDDGCLEVAARSWSFKDDLPL